MIRICFNCDEKTLITLRSEQWDVVGVGIVELGVAICPRCGLVLRNPAPSEDATARWYQSFSNYTNPGRAGAPSPRKVAYIDHLLAWLKDNSIQGGTVFQVGCSNGYTLHRLQQAGFSVNGIDPSAAAIGMATAQWGLRLQTGFFENYSPGPQEQYDLIVVSHVLEHVIDPIDMLAKCRAMLSRNGKILIQVPALVWPEAWPPGYFSFEHLQYFSPTALDNSLRRARLRRLGTPEVERELDIYPGQTVLAVEADAAATPATDYEAARHMVEAYLARETQEWKRIDALIMNRTSATTRIAVWGAGVHTSQLLARTGMRSRTVVACVDADPQKHGQAISGWPTIASPSSLDPGDDELVLLISSFAAEKEIYRAARAMGFRDAHIIAPHGGSGSA